MNNTKYRANTLAAILQDWKSMETAMSYYEQGQGSMLEESAKTVQTLSAQLTNLKTAGQELVSKFFNADDWSGIIKVIVNITQKLTDLVDTLTAIPTILASITAVSLVKNGGRIKCLSSVKCRHLNCFLLIGKFLFQTLVITTNTISGIH